MTPGESHNEWYQYYCSNFYVFKQDQYFIINYLIPLLDHFIAPVGKSLLPHYDCPFDLPSMTPGESQNEWYQYYCSNFYVFKQYSALCQNQILLIDLMVKISIL